MHLLGCTCEVRHLSSSDLVCRAWVCDCRTAEQKVVKNWDDASCIMQKECRPHLIGIKESTLVSLCSQIFSAPMTQREYSFQP